MSNPLNIVRPSASRPETTLSPNVNASWHMPDNGATYPSGFARDVVARSKTLDVAVEAVICIPTFRRPEHLRLTLSSVAAQVTERRFAVIIVENDAAKRGSVPEATRFFTEHPIPGLCVVETRQGNCQAINAAFETARTVFPSATKFLMIDDDEIASRHWLERMISAADGADADIVGGPVLPQFVDHQDDYLAEHPAFRPAYAATGPVPMIYGSGNCLIQRRVFERLASPSFDLRFNFLGGGDTDFFLRCRESGMTFHWNAEAVITETVPQSRTSLKWLMLRGLRIGAINYHAQFKTAQTALSRLTLLAKFIGLLPLSLARTGQLATRKAPTPVALHPMMVAIGGVLAALGIEQQPYKGSIVARERLSLS